MPYLHHLGKSKGSVKTRSKIKLERYFGPEILAAIAGLKTIEIIMNLDCKSD